LLQFTELCTYKKTTNTDKPSSEQEGHEKPDLEVQFEQALDIHKELVPPEPIQLAPILPASQQVISPMAQQPTLLTGKLRGEAFM
jgi:hypothetical protein